MRRNVFTGRDDLEFLELCLDIGLFGIGLGGLDHLDAPNTLLGDFVDLTVKNLKKGHKIRVTGLGIFQVRKRPARMGRNPATGEAIKIKASKKLAFRAAKEVKDAI